MLTTYSNTTQKQDGLKLKSGTEQLGLCVDNVNLLGVNTQKKKQKKRYALLLAYREVCLDGVMCVDQILCSRLANETTGKIHNVKLGNAVLGNVT